jgi:hypothetical protein
VKEIVDLLHVLVGERLDVVLQLAVLVLGDLAVLFLLLQRVEPGVADVADGDARLLGVFRGDSGQLLAPLLVEVGDRDAQRLALAASGPRSGG